MNNKKKTIKTSQKYYKLILYLVVILLINLVGSSFFFRLDLTSNGLYSLSDASKKVVSTLNEPLTINVFFSKNLPPPYNNIGIYLHDLLQEYELYSNDNLSYRFYDVTAEDGDLNEEVEENRKIARGYGIAPVNIRKIEKDETRMQKVFMGIALIHGDLVGRIPAVTSTNGLEYNITNAIQEMNSKISALVNLPGKIEVTLVLSSSLFQIARAIKFQGLDTLTTGLRDVVERMNKRTSNQLQFVHIDPSRGEGTPGQLGRFERFELQWPEIKTAAGSVVPAGKGLAAIGMSYGQKSVERDILKRKMAPGKQGLEEQFVILDMKILETIINDNINNVIDINNDLGYLKTHGAMPLRDLPPQYPPPPQWKKREDLKRLNGLLSRKYSLKEITLEEPIPENIQTLIISGVKDNFTDQQLFRIDQFLMKGKSLALFIDAFNEIEPQGQQENQQAVYLPLNTGLEKILAHYGLKVKKSYLLDENCYIRRERMSREMPLYYAPIIKDENINHSLAFMENIKRLLMIKIAPLEADIEKIEKNNLELEQLFASTDKSWEMADQINLAPLLIRPPGQDTQKKSKPLAYLLEGEFPSYFADKPIPGNPGKKDEEKEETGSWVRQPAVKVEKGILAKGNPGKIFLIGSSQILRDNMVDEKGQSSNAVFLLNIMDYLNNQEDIAVMRSKNQRFNPLKDTGVFVKTFVKIFNILGLPALFILVGIITWFRRLAWKKRIRDIFTRGSATPS